MRSEGDRSYPPYDIEKTSDDAYRITLAAAGFKADELELTAMPNLLIVAGRKAGDDKERTFLHRGIAGRNFERRFELADYVVVKSASYADGELSIELAREVPEALKPRRVEITGDRPAPQTLPDQGDRRAA
jgi:molecular chaperone IbpA